MKKVILLIALAIPTLSHSQPYAFSLTGDMLIRKFYGPNFTKPLTGPDYLEREVVRGYLNGIKDATEGSAWCYVGNLHPDELDTILVMALERLPAYARKANAAPLVVDVLKQKYPCPVRKK